MATPKFCMECGGKLADNAKFCPGCGAKVPQSVATEPAATPAPQAAPEAPAATSERPAAPALAAAPALTTPPTSQPAPAAAKAKAPLPDSDDDDDGLAMPDDEAAAPKAEAKPKPMGLIIMLCFVGLIVGAGATIAASPELNQRFKCNILGNKAACVTEEDRLFEVEQAEKKEEIDLMAHRYGGFDLMFTPEDIASFTIRQHRYEEDRKDFVQRARAGGAGTRTRKETKTGVYEEKKFPDGIIKGTVAFSANAPRPVTYEPQPNKKIVLPLALPELPLLEREQADGNGKRLSAEDVVAIEKEKEKGGDAAKNAANLKVKTVAISTWVYEIAFTAPGYKPRTVWFYEGSPPSDLDLKKIEAEGGTARAFKRRPDGRFVIDNASFDLTPEPRTLWGRYLAALKELHCLQQSKEFQGKSEQGKADAEALLWEQKAFGQETLAIARQNDADPEWIKHRDEQFKGYTCPTM